MALAGFNGVAQDDRPQSTALRTRLVDVPISWIDYNGHMTEAQYYMFFADAGEVFLRSCGFSEAYRAQGFSFFNVQGQQRNLRECQFGATVACYSEIIGFDHLRLHTYQYIVDTQRNLTLATCEHMMLHVDTRLRKATPMTPDMQDALAHAAERHRPRLRPKGLGCVFHELPGEGLLTPS